MTTIEIIDADSAVALVKAVLLGSAEAGGRVARVAPMGLDKLLSRRDLRA